MVKYYLHKQGISCYFFNYRGKNNMRGKCTHGINLIHFVLILYIII